jgi:hypothetical protein
MSDEATAKAGVFRFHLPHAHLARCSATANRTALMVHNIRLTETVKMLTERVESLTLELHNRMIPSRGITP